jgi:hypothetical protein
MLASFNMLSLDLMNIRKQISSISFNIERLRNMSYQLDESENNFSDEEVYVEKIKKTITFDDISSFYKCTNKNENDLNNKKREKIVYAMIEDNIPLHWYRDDRWKCMKRRLSKFIREEISDGLDYKLELKASRTHNFDFLIKFSNDIEKKLEFKFNLTDISDTPQFLSLSTNSLSVNLGNKSYGEFFYDTCISDIEKLYNTKAPCKEEYLKYLYQINPLKHDFFHIINNDKSNDKKEEKKRIVDESIHDFLRMYSNRLDIQRLNNKLKNSQEEKIFMLYCYKQEKFFKDMFKNEELTVTKILTLKRNSNGLVNTIVLETGCKTTTIHMLLRWRNQAGILNPAWQIKLVRCKNE